MRSPQMMALRSPEGGTSMGSPLGSPYPQQPIKERVEQLQSCMESMRAVLAQVREAGERLVLESEP